MNNHSFSSRAELKNARSFTHLHGEVFRHRDNFTFIKRLYNFKSLVELIVVETALFCMKIYVLQVTKYMEQSPSEANSHSACQEIPHFLSNPVNKSPPLIPILSQMNPFHTLPTYFSKIHSNIIFPSTPRSSATSPPSTFSDEKFIRFYHLSHACYMPYPSHLP